KLLADGFDSSSHVAQDLVLCEIEELVPGDDFRPLHQQAPKFDEIAIGWALVLQRRLDELVQFGETGFGALQIYAVLARDALMVFAKTGHARRGDALGMTGAERVQ